MVGPRDDGWGGPGGVDGLHHLRGVAPQRRGQRIGVVLPGVELVEAAGEAFGGASGVDEHQRRTVLHDLRVDVLLDVRPDGPLLRQGGLGGLPGGAEAQPVVDGRLPDRRARLGDRQVGHVLDADAHPEFPGLLRGRGDDLDGPVAAEEVGDGRQGPDGGGEADALEVAGQPRQSLEAEGEVDAAFRAGEGVDLVDDDGVDVLQDARGLRREHEVGGLGRRDEDVRRPAYLPRPLRRRGIPGAHPDGDVRHIQPEALRDPGDARQRGAEVVLHVDAERLERRDVEHPHAPFAVAFRRPHRQRQLSLPFHQVVQCPEEGGEGLAGACRGDDERVVPRGDRLPGGLLNGGGGSEDLLEPGGHLRAEPGEDASGHAQL